MDLTSSSCPMFSLLMPTRNSLPYVKAQVDSILAQSVQDWEIIAIDGMSTDGTWEYLLSMSGMDSRFKVSQAPANGVYAGLNECLRRASGDWVLFTMSDDTVLPSCLERLRREIMTPCDATIIHFRIKIIDEKGNDSDFRWDERLSVRYWGDKILHRHWRNGIDEYWRHILYGSVYISLTELAVMRRFALQAPSFDETIGGWADILWTARVVRYAQILHISDLLATWRIRPGQTTLLQEKGTFARNHLLLIDKLMAEDCDETMHVRYLEYRRLAEKFYNYRGDFGSEGPIRRRLRYPDLFFWEIVEWLRTGKNDAATQRIKELRQRISVA